MNRLVKIAQLATPRTEVQYRRVAYGNRDVRRFLRDVIALANIEVEGPRYIVIGIDFDDNGRKHLHPVSEDDFSGKPPYQSLLLDFIEPQIRLQYTPITIEGTRLGIFEIPHCQDKPYMMRIDHSETLRRGDAFVRINDASVKLGRQQLQKMFEKKFREDASARRIEIGFPGEIIHKTLKVKTVDLTAMPSVVASAKLTQLLDVQANSKNSGATTVMARLTHARLFGSDDPYQTKTRWELIEEMAQIKLKHQVDDQRFLFEDNAEQLQLVIYNQGNDPIENASFSLAMPNHESFHVADKLPKPARDSFLVDQNPFSSGEYPGVRIDDNVIHVSRTIGKIPCGEPVHVFDVPLRICIGSELKGRKFGIRYSLSAANLHSSAKGTLRLIF